MAVICIYDHQLTLWKQRAAQDAKGPVQSFVLKGDRQIEVIDNYYTFENFLDKLTDLLFVRPHRPHSGNSLQIRYAVWAAKQTSKMKS